MDPRTPSKPGILEPFELSKSDASRHAISEHTHFVMIPVTWPLGTHCDEVSKMFLVAGVQFSGGV